MLNKKYPPAYRRGIYKSILESKKSGKKQFAVLIDPDKLMSAEGIDIAESAGVDYFFMGGSLITGGNLENCIEGIKKRSSIPIVLFPGNTLQISPRADGILFLSLISGRNAEMLIGKHVEAAPLLRSSALEILPTGYMLIENGKQTTASYMSNSTPIPADKDQIALCTAMAGEMLGLKLIYMDAGSGAINPVSASMIKKVKENISVPLIIGGGIRTPQSALKACKAGADVIVVGNAIEKDNKLMKSIAEAVHAY